MLFWEGFYRQFTAIALDIGMNRHEMILFAGLFHSQTPSASQTSYCYFVVIQMTLLALCLLIPWTTRLFHFIRQHFHFHSSLLSHLSFHSTRVCSIRKFLPACYGPHFLNLKLLWWLLCYCYFLWSSEAFYFHIYFHIYKQHCSCCIPASLHNWLPYLPSFLHLFKFTSYQMLLYLLSQAKHQSRVI